MKISYRDVDYSDAQDRSRLVRWYNDPEIKHLYSLFTNEEGFGVSFTSEYFERVGRNPPTQGPHRTLMILVDGVAVGEAKFEMDAPKLLTKAPHTAWLALVIGEAEWRGRGLGGLVVQHLENLARETGAQRVEVGIFEYNGPSLRFFQRRGYVEFARQSNRVWWNGKMWANVRLRKTLSP